MGGKARWRKLQRVVGCLPLGPHASFNKHRQRQERARTRDAKRRRLGDEGKEEAVTILIGKKQEKNKEEENHNTCKERSKSDKEIEKLHHQQEKVRDGIKAQWSDNDKSSFKDKTLQEAVELQAGVWMASPCGWVFQPLSDTTVEEELGKAQEEEEEEEEEENGQRDHVHNNGQRIAKFFQSDDESDSDTAIFIDVCHPVLPEKKGLQPSVTPCTASTSHKETHPDGLLENSSEFPVEFQMQIPLEAEKVELVLADENKDDEISKNRDPLAKVTTMEAVVTDCPHHDTHRGDLPPQFLEADGLPDLVGADCSSELNESSVNKQPPNMNKPDVAVSIGSTDCIKSGSADNHVRENTMMMEEERETDSTHDMVHFEVDCEPHSTPNISASRDQVTPATSSEPTTVASPCPKPDFSDASGEDQIVLDIIYRGDGDAESLFFSLYPEYNPSDPEESEGQDTENGVPTSSNNKNLYSQSCCEAPQDGEESMCTASQNSNVQEGEEHLPKDLQGIHDGPHSTNPTHDVSYDASLTSILDPPTTLIPEITSISTLHHPNGLHHELHQSESSVCQLKGLEEGGTEAGQDALEVESTLEMERTPQTLVGKAREWIKGVARMGSTRRGDAYGKLPILEATEDISSFRTGMTEDDAEGFTPVLDTIPAEAQVGLSSGGDVRVYYIPEENHEVSFASVENVKDIPVSGSYLGIHPTDHENVALHSSLKWDSLRCSHSERDIPKDAKPVEDPKESSESDMKTKNSKELVEDLKGNKDSCPSYEEARTTQEPVQYSLTTKNVMGHYLLDENMDYFTHTIEGKDCSTPDEDLDNHPTTTGDKNLHPTCTMTPQACYPLPDAMVFSPTLEDSHDLSLNTYMSSEVCHTPKEDINTPYTPSEGLELICSSSELLQGHYMPEKDSTIHGTPLKELKTQYTHENDPRNSNKPVKGKDAYYMPDSQDMKQYHTPTDIATSYKITEEQSNCHISTKEQSTYASKNEEGLNFTPAEGKKCHCTPAAESDNNKSAEKQDANYTYKEEKEEQITLYRSEEDHCTNKPEEEEPMDHYTSVKEKIYCTLEKQKDFHPSNEESFLYYTPTDEGHTYYTPTKEVNRFSTPTEDEEVTRTPNNEPNIYHKPAEEEMINYTPDEQVSTGDNEEHMTHNAINTTPNVDYHAPVDEWNPYYTPVMETNITSTPAEEKTGHCTPDTNLSPSAMENKNTGIPKDYYTPVTCAPGEKVTHYTTDNETHHIPDSQLETLSTPREKEGEEEEEGKNEEEGERTEKRVEDEGNTKDEEQERKDYIERDINRRRKESEQKGRPDSDRKERKESEGEERRGSERDERRNNKREKRSSEREERKTSEQKEWRDNEREGRKDDKKEERNDSEREVRKDSEKEESKDSEREESKGSEEERRDSDKEGRRDSKREEKRNSEREGRKDSEREARGYSEREGRRDTKRKEKKDSERDKRKSSETQKSRHSKREGGEDSDRERRMDSERERSKNTGRKERKDKEEEREDGEKKKGRGTEMEGRKASEKEEMRDSEREGKGDSEREDTRDSKRKEREDSEKNSEKERKDSEKEERKDNMKEERKDSERQKRIRSSMEEKKDTERERRRLSDWEWRRNSDGEGRKDSDWEKRRNSEGKWRCRVMEEKKESEMEESTEKQTLAQAASIMLIPDNKHLTRDEDADILNSQQGKSMASETDSAVSKLDSHGVGEETGIFGPTVPQNPLEVVTLEKATPPTEQTGVSQHRLRGGRVKSMRDFNFHQKHVKAKQQYSDPTNGATTGKAESEDIALKDIKREWKSGNKRRRNRRNRGTKQGELETSTIQSQSASRTAETKPNPFRGSSWEMEVPLEREIHHHSIEYPSQRQREPHSSRESLASSSISDVFHQSVVTHQDDNAATPGPFKKSDKIVPYQKKQQVNLKNKFPDSLAKEDQQQVERFSEEQKAVGAGEFAVAGSLGKAGSKGAQNSERRRGKGNEKVSQRNGYGREILQEKLISEKGTESVGMPTLSRVWSPRIEHKDRKEGRKERKEKKLSEKSDVKKAEIKSPREELSGVAKRDGSGASKSCPPLLDTPQETIPFSVAQKWDAKPTGHISPDSPLGASPPPVPSRSRAKLRYPEALLQPLSPPPSPPLQKSCEVKEKTKTISSEMKIMREASITPDPPSYTRRATSQSIIYTIPETALTTPQQIEQSTPNLHVSKSVKDQPQCPPEPLFLKDASKYHPPDSPKTSWPACLHGKQTQDSSNNSPSPPSHDTLQSAPKSSHLSSSSLADPQPSHKQKMSPSYSSISHLPSPLPLKQESAGLSTVIPTPKPLLVPKTTLAEFDTLQSPSAEEENIPPVNPKPGVEEARPLGSPRKVSVAQRIKFPESPLCTTKPKANISRGRGMSHKPDLPQPRSTATQLVQSGEGDATVTAAASLSNKSSTMKTTSKPEAPSKLLRVIETSPQIPSPHMASSSPRHTDATESVTLPASDKPLQKIVSSPQTRHLNVYKPMASDSIMESKFNNICAEQQTGSQQEEGFREQQTESPLAEEDWINSNTKSQQQPQQGFHSFFREGIVSPKEGSPPHFCDIKMMKKKRRR